MRKYIINFLTFLIAAVCSVSCASFTYVTKTVYYPLGADRSTAEYTLFISIRGERGHAYIERGNKIINVSIKRNGREVLSKQHKVVAGDLDSKIIWETPTNIKITYFEMDKDTQGSESKEYGGMRVILSMDYEIELE